MKSLNHVGILNLSIGHPKRLLIFRDPFGGKRSAPKFFADEVKPLLEGAAIKFDLQDLISLL